MSNYRPSDLSIQNRMLRIMKEQMRLYPSTHQSPFGGAAMNSLGCGSIGGNVVGGMYSGGKKKRKPGRAKKPGRPRKVGRPKKK